MQETLGAGFKQVTMATLGTGPAPGFPQIDLSAFKSLNQTQPDIRFEPGKLMELQQRYIAGASALWNQGLQASDAAPAAVDRRSSDPAWQANPIAKFLSFRHQLNANTLMSRLEAANSTPRPRPAFVSRSSSGWGRFGTQQLSPNEAQKSHRLQRPEHRQGHGQHATDMKQGHVNMTDESAYL